MSFLVLEKHEIVFQAVGAQDQIVAIGLKVEDDARGLVDAPLQTLEAQRDRTLAEVLNVLDVQP